MVTGSAPVAAEVLNFFMVVLGCDIREGYGQT
jgi:long-subunit acyl-CoA synthetase (AMP-forming)